MTQAYHLARDVVGWKTAINTTWAANSGRVDIPAEAGKVPQIGLISLVDSNSATSPRVEVLAGSFTLWGKDYSGGDFEKDFNTPLPGLLGATISVVVAAGTLSQGNLVVAYRHISEA